MTFCEIIKIILAKIIQPKENVCSIRLYLTGTGLMRKKKSKKNTDQQPNDKAARPLAVGMRRALQLLGRSQWWGEEELRRYQFRLLRPLLLHAFETVPYYQQQFAAAGLRPEAITAENWSRVPILSREALQVNTLLSSRVPREHGRIFETQTSGSTGQPVTVSCTERTNFYWQVFAVRDHLWHQRNLAGVLASIRRFSAPNRLPEEGGRTPNWGPATAALFKTGPAVLLDIGTEVGRQLQWLVRHNPDYLLTYPSNLAALIERSAYEGVTMAGLKEVRTIGEVVSAELRVACREVWGVKLVDTYSSQELGYIATQCPGHAHYHVQSENVLVEVLDEQGQACRAGETGRLVITSLHNYATPLIRYEIRDYAELGAACACGRGLPVINRIMGRRRNLITLPSGEKRWPLVGFSRYAEVLPIRQFQFVQQTVDRIEMRLVVEGKMTGQQEDRLRGIICEALGWPFTISFTPVDVIPQGPGGKFEEFISLLS